MVSGEFRDAVDELRHATDHVDDTDVRTQIEQIMEALEDAEEWEQGGTRLHEVERKLHSLADEVEPAARERLDAAADDVRAHEAYRGRDEE